ncbi:hypothetical protein KJ682_02980 [bacterium]|nr:hypothetical protein [bacterium]
MKIGIIIMASTLWCVAGPATAETDCLLETPAEVAVRFYEAMGARDFTTAVACLHPDVHAEFIERFDLEPTPQNRERLDTIAVLYGAADIDELREWEPARIMAAHYSLMVKYGPPTDAKPVELRFEVLDQRMVSDTEAAVILRVLPSPGYPENNIDVPLEKTAGECWRLTEMGQFLR